MSRYETSTPRAALRLTAVAMAVITMGTLVVLPAQLGSVSAQAYTLAAAKSAADSPGGITGAPARGAVGSVDREAGVGSATLGAQECARPHKSSWRSPADS
jgi:hypothetical protein